MTISGEDKDKILIYINGLKVQIQSSLNQISSIENVVIALSYEPCLICKRRVSNPCNTKENYHENGPWDYNCEALIYPERFEE